MNQLLIEPIPAFADNYIWMIRDPGAAVVAVVDPGDADPVLESLRRQHLELGAILVTHHHRDHIGGVSRLQSAFPRVEVFAPRDDRIPGATQRLGEGDSVILPGLGASVEVMEVPGHTSSHIAFQMDQTDGPALFCGDTLFSVGCGRVFDGTVEQLAHSLQRLAQLPGAVRCYCAHEYTADNIGFAQWVEPGNAALAERAVGVASRREINQPTVPSTLELELATNPFLRANQPEVIAAAERWSGGRLPDSTAVFAALRRWKDQDYD